MRYNFRVFRLLQAIANKMARQQRLRFKLAKSINKAKANLALFRYTEFLYSQTLREVYDLLTFKTMQRKTNLVYVVDIRQQVYQK